MSGATNRPRVLVLRAPGINCERECHTAFQMAGGAPEFLHARKLLAQPELLDRYSILMVPGGFSFGDDIAAGRVLGHELRHGIGEQLAAFVDRGGLVLGICNGFQVLVRLGLLPRTGGGALQEEVTLTWNRVGHYVCKWVTMKVPATRCVFLQEGDELRYPAAHAEGRMVTGIPGGLQGLLDEGFAAFRYVDGDGNPTEAWPASTNGTALGIAGLTDTSGRVLGVMPHPDRAFLGHHMPDWHRTGLPGGGAMPGIGDGMALFESMVKVAKAEG